VCDYILAKDKIFASSIRGRRGLLYESIYKLLVSTLPKPDLSSTSRRVRVLLSRVASGDRLRTKHLP